jgi:FkbM family methyltransferase
MNIKALYRNPIYRATPESIVRRFLGATFHPPFGSEFETRLYWGDRLISVYDNEMGAYQWQYGFYDLAVCEMLARILKPGHFAVDVGANVGQMTLLMSRAVGPGGSTECFEPHPYLAGLLQKNRANAPFKDRITARACAVSDHNGVANLSVPREYKNNMGTSSLEVPAGEGGTVLEVPICTLDSIYRERTSIDLIKVDVEGHEPAVFRGAATLLQKKVVRCILFEERNYAKSSIPDLLTGHGYHLFAIRDDDLLHRPLGKPDQSPGSINFLAVRDLRDADAINAHTDLALKRLVHHRWRNSLHFIRSSIAHGRPAKRS